jgi:hypothetical protein
MGMGKELISVIHLCAVGLRTINALCVHVCVRAHVCVWCVCMCVRTHVCARVHMHAGSLTDHMLGLILF